MRQPNSREMLAVVRQLCVLMRLGYPLSEGLKTMADDASPWLAKVAGDLDRGDTLDQAMERQPRLFSPLFLELIRAAQRGPNPGLVMEALSRWLERSDSLARKVHGALLYPLLLTLVLLVFLGLALGSFVPDIFLPMALATGGGGSLRSLAGLLPWLALPVLLLAFLICLALLGVLPIQPFIAWIPGLVALRELAAQSLWARAFATLLGSGLIPLEALDKSLSIVQSPVLRNHLSAAVEKMRKGSTLEQAVAPGGGLEPRLAWSLAGGSSGEELARRLFFAADELETELDLRASSQLRLLGPRALIVLGIVAGAAILCFWAPFYNLAMQL